MLSLKINQYTTKLTLLILCLFSLSSPTYSQPHSKQNLQLLIPAFDAQYNILRQGDVVGKATRSLTYLDEGHAQYQFNTDIKWFIFSDRRVESSLISISEGKISPLSFSYNREGTGKDKLYQLRFDKQERKVTDIKKNKVISTDLPIGTQDQLSHHLALQQDLIEFPKKLSEADSFSYTVMKGSGRLKSYTYTYDGTEEIMLPYGLVKAVKLKQENESKTRTTYAWFAPELNFLLVKLFQVKEGVEQFETQLTQLKN